MYQINSIVDRPNYINLAASLSMSANVYATARPPYQTGRRSHSVLARPPKLSSVSCDLEL